MFSLSAPYSDISDTMTTLPQNLYRRERDFFYNATDRSVSAGVVKRKTFPLTDEVKAIEYADECNARLKEWREAITHINRLQKNGKIKDIIYAYLHSADFTCLSASTQNNYRSYIELWRHVRVMGMSLEDVKLSVLETPMIQRMYDDQIKKSSTHITNSCLSCFRLITNFAIRHGFTRHNPFEKIKRRSVKSRKVMWKREEVLAFLNTSFIKWQWRNVGIIFYMLYEWGQRVSDILNLEWEDIDFDKAIVIITQSKRGAKVTLPITDGLMQMLKQQKKDFFLSKYVVPQMVRRRGKFVPYSIHQINGYFRDILRAANLNDNLQMRDLRRTAITETIEQGGDIITVMQMSGHQNVSSVMPYFVHTLKGATKAQEIRGFPSELVQITLLQRGDK